MHIAVPIALHMITHNAAYVQTKLEKPIIINGRPTYRSIPSRRSGFRPVRKIDYYMYSTAING